MFLILTRRVHGRQIEDMSDCQQPQVIVNKNLKSEKFSIGNVMESFSGGVCLH